MWNLGLNSHACLMHGYAAEKRERKITVESGENAKMHALQLILMISEAWKNIMWVAKEFA